MFFFCSNIVWAIRALTKKQPTNNPCSKSCCAYWWWTSETADPKVRQSSSSYSPTKASKLQNPKNNGHTCSTVRCYQSTQGSTSLQQGISWWSSTHCAFHSSRQTQGVPSLQAPHRLPSTAPCISGPGTPTTKSTSRMLNVKMTQSMPHSFSFPQAFIYSLPCILHLQIFLRQEGFLAKAAPAHMEVFHSAWVCITLTRLFESQLKTNLIQGFCCLHKGRLQKHGRKGWVNINSQELIRVLTVALTDSQHLTVTVFIPLQ